MRVGRLEMKGGRGLGWAEREKPSFCPQLQVWAAEGGAWLDPGSFVTTVLRIDSENVADLRPPKTKK